MDNTLQHTAISHCTTLQHTATHCNTLQHTATHCNTLHHTATHCPTTINGPRRAQPTTLCNSLQWLQHTLISHCNTLQHTATHCDTPQQTATHCNTTSADHAALNGHKDTVIALWEAIEAYTDLALEDEILEYGRCVTHISSWLIWSWSYTEVCDSYY